MDGRESRRFSRKREDFLCDFCNARITGNGYTDHCPNCLWGRHVDVNPGDRAASCMGPLEPVRTEHDRNGFVITYRCKRCRSEKKMRAAQDDNEVKLAMLLNR